MKIKSTEELAIEIVNRVFNTKIDIVNARQLSFDIVNAFAHFPKRIMELEKDVCDANKGAEINFKANESLVDKKIELEKKILQLEEINRNLKRQLEVVVQALKDIRNTHIPNTNALYIQSGINQICSIIDSTLKNVENE